METKEAPVNSAVLHLRELVARKKAIKKQMREELRKDPAFMAAVEELTRRHGSQKA